MPVISKEEKNMIRNVHLAAETAAAIAAIMKKWKSSSLGDTIPGIIRENIEYAGLPAIAAEPRKHAIFPL